ncbi:hypothetical protein MIR68_008112 [Amoeboaphelidium protococcarum]|nr:hypothetical protein MIR68_008112 [Amoeboaphelidium protococcarum]
MYHYACLLVSLQDLSVVSALPLQDDDQVSIVQYWLGCSLLSLLGEEHQDDFKQLLVKLYDKKDYLSVRTCDCKFGGRLTLVTGLLIDQNTALLRLSSGDANYQQSERNLQPLNNFEKYLQRFLDDYEKSKANGADQKAQGPLALLSAASDALEHADDFIGAYDVTKSDYVTGRHSDFTMQDLGINEHNDTLNADDYAVYHHADTNVALLQLTDQILMVYSSPKRPLVNDSGYEGSNSNLDEFANFITSPVNQFFDNAKDPLRALSRAAGTQTASVKSSHDKKVVKKRSNIRKKKAHHSVTLGQDGDNEGNSKQDAKNLRVDTKFKLEEKITMMKSAKILRQLNQHCESCGIRDSPEWRKGPNGLKTLCNACGLKYARKIAKSSNRQLDSGFPQTPQESPVHTSQISSGSGDNWEAPTQSAITFNDPSTPSKPAQQLIAPKLPLLMQSQQQPTLDPNSALAQQLYTNYQPLMPKYQLVPVFQYVSPMTSVQQQKYTPRMFPQGFMSPQMLRGQFITPLETIQRPVAKLPISPVKRQAAKSNQ